jgi:hypothetical protein
VGLRGPWGVRRIRPSQLSATCSRLTAKGSVTVTARQRSEDLGVLSQNRVGRDVRPVGWHLRTVCGVPLAPRKFGRFRPNACLISGFSVVLVLRTVLVVLCLCHPGWGEIVPGGVIVPLGQGIVGTARAPPDVVVLRMAV